MQLSGIHHLNVRCTEADLAPIEKFYTEVVGLRKGYRPDFKNVGIWLYDGDHPLVHVTVRCKEGDLGGDKHNSAVDHIAFRSFGASDFRAHLDRLGMKYQAAERAAGRLPDFPARSYGHHARVQFPQRGSARSPRFRHARAAHPGRMKTCDTGRPGTR